MRLKRLVAAACALLLLLGAAPLFSTTVKAEEARVGRDYYVSNMGDNSQDATSPEAAWQTLDKLSGIEFQPGDRILLEAGSVFYGYLHPTGSGTEEHPITIDAYKGAEIGEAAVEAGGRPVIHTNGEGIWYQNYNGPMDNNTNTDDFNHSHMNRGYVSSSILLYDVEHYRISNLELTNREKGPGAAWDNYARMDKTGVAGVAQNIGTMDGIHLKNLYIHDVEGNIQHKHMNNGGIQFNVYKPLDEATGIARYNDILIEGCRVESVSRLGIGVGYTYNGKKFEGAAISEEVATTYGHTNVVIRNNYVKDAGGDAICPMYSYKPLVEYNISERAAYDYHSERTGTTFGYSCAIWPWKCKDAVFQYNEAYGTVYNGDGQAYDCDYSDRTIYQYNYSHDNEGGFMLVCQVEAYQSIIRYNISQNDLIAVMMFSSNPKAEVYNNTFYMKNGVRFIRTSGSGGVASIDNNILYYTGTTPLSQNWRTSTISYSNNLFYGFGTQLPTNAVNSITADPLFVDPGKGETGTLGNIALDTLGGYALQEGSPAINAGKYIQNNGGKDFFGNPLDSLPDIGAYDSGTPSDGFSVELGELVEDPGYLFKLPAGTTVGQLLGSVVYEAASYPVVEVQNAENIAVDASTVIIPGAGLKLVLENSSGTRREFPILFEYEVGNLTATAGNFQEEEGPEMAIDNNPATLWHTSWDGSELADQWLMLELTDSKELCYFEYLPRGTGGTNGIITKYEIWAGDNPEQLEKVAEGSWAANSDRKYAFFPATQAKYIKMQTVEAVTTQTKLFASAAEVRVGGSNV